MKRFFSFGASKTIDFDPQDIGFIQYPEFFWQPDQNKNITSVISGNWDREIDAELYWSGKYETLDGARFGMISLDQYVFFNSLRDRFLRNKSWDDTGWLKWMRESNNIKRYETEEKIQERLRFLENLFDWFLAGNVEIFETDIPTINIGRGNRISIDHGRHRLCMSIIAGLSEIPVRVKTVHPEARETKYGKTALDSVSGGRAHRLKSLLRARRR